MKKYLLGLAVMSGLAMSQVSAQNYCAPQCDPCCDVSDFNGLYLGGNLGVFSHVAHRNDFGGFLVDRSGWTTINTNFEAGLQLGYDWQCCNKLFGLVWDWNWTTSNNRRHRLNESDATFFRNSHRWFTTIRGRFGLTVCDALVYVTIGAVGSKINTRWADGADDFRHNRTRWGWTAGVGTEFLVWCNWSFGAEVLFMHFGEKRRSFNETTVLGHSDSGYLARFLVNYRFGDLCSWWSCCR